MPGIFGFPYVIKMDIETYDKFVSESRILQFLTTILNDRQFPGIQYKLHTGQGPNDSLYMVPAVSGRQNEPGLVVTHSSDIFKTIYVIYRAVNIGKLTVVSRWFCSTYQQKFVQAKAAQSSSCSFQRTAEQLPIKTTGENIVNGAFTKLRPTDGTDQDLWSNYEYNTLPKNDKLRPAPNRSIPRAELYSSFMYICDLLWTQMTNYIGQYQ